MYITLRVSLNFRALKRPQYTHITVFSCESRVLSDCRGANISTLQLWIGLINVFKLCYTYDQHKSRSCTATLDCVYYYFHCLQCTVL